MSNMPTTNLSIIITTYKNIPLAAQCMESVVRSCSSSPNLTYEIIISDSATTETKMNELEQIQHRHARRITNILVHRDNIGYPKAVNAGLRNAHGEYLLVMNSDTVVLENAIPDMLSYLEEHPEVGILAPQLLNPHGDILASTYKFYRWYTIPLRRTMFGKLPHAQKHLVQFEMLDWNHQATQAVDWIQGSVMMLSRKSLNSIGLMDENIFLYFEDVDWCKRSWEHNLRVVYHPNAKVIHHHARESAGKRGIFSVFSNDKLRVHLKSALYYYRKYWRDNPFPKSYHDLLPHSSSPQP